MNMQTYRIHKTDSSSTGHALADDPRSAFSRYLKTFGTAVDTSEIGIEENADGTFNAVYREENYLIEPISLEP